jgi:serine/threonine protein kinase
MVQFIAQRYQILEELGRGGMGTVYRGLDTVSNQVVAIKELNPQLTTTELIERFKREGEALRELNHPNIVKLLDTVEYDGAYYLVMEYVTGGDLHDLLKAGQLPIERCLRLALDLADALTRAHKLDIIHRDLKPANVLLADDGTLRLSDFGVARIGQKERVTATDMIVGTIDYLAPEALDGAGIDPRADIWAFGVMLFEMLAGKRPFSGESLTATLTAILTHPVPDLESLRPDAPVALIDLIYRMLEKERDVRIRTVRHVGAELEDILSGHHFHTPPQTRFAPPTPDFLQRPKHNLPAQTTPFVGREAELSELAKLLDNPKIRLITIAAQGGMGKTRLALELAEQALTPDTSSKGRGETTKFENGVYFVELAPLSDAANIVSAIAEAVGYQFQADGRDQKQQILDFLGNKNLLLVMDNYEHLLEGANLVTDILKAAPSVKILATSRQRLNQSGETLFNLEGMDFPAWETPEDALEYAAVKLFVQSAKRAKPDFEIRADNMNAIARICKLVQGLPLGIVLAAAWLSMLSPDEIATEIAQSLDFLASDIGDMPERQRSMRAVFDYSWNLLTDDEKQVFMKLSVFRGGFTREAAEAVAGANLRVLMSLMNKSLIRRNADTGRYEIHELLRQYGEIRLSESQLTLIARDQHSMYYAELLQQLQQKSAPISRWIAIDIDFENLAKAWRYRVETTDSECILKLMPILSTYWDFRARYQEAIDLLEYAIVKFNTAEQTNPIRITLGRLLGQLGWFYNGLGQPELGIEPATQGRIVSLEMEDVEGIFDAYIGIGICYSFIGRLEETWEFAQEGLNYFREKNIKWAYTAMLYWACGAAINLGRYDEARLLGLEHRQLVEEANDKHGLGINFVFILGFVNEMTGAYSEATWFYEQGMKLLIDLDYTWGIAVAYQYLGNVALAQKHLIIAVDHYRNALAIMNKRRSIVDMIGVLLSIPGLLAAQGKGQQAVRLASLLLNYPLKRKVHIGGPSTLATIHRILPELKLQLGEATYATAWERGKSLDLDTVVKELLTEFGKDA